TEFHELAAKYGGTASTNTVAATGKDTAKGKGKKPGKDRAETAHVTGGKKRSSGMSRFRGAMGESDSEGGYESNMISPTHPVNGTRKAPTTTLMHKFSRVLDAQVLMMQGGAEPAPESSEDSSSSGAEANSRTGPESNT